MLTIVVPKNKEVPNWCTMTLDFGINVFANDTLGYLRRFDNRKAHDVQDKHYQTWELNAGNLGEHLDELRSVAYKASYLAVRTKAMAASLMNLPNAATTFGSDPIHMPRAGDYLKAFTYADFLDHPDEPERIMELPVAKAVVRAMDTIQDYARRSFSASIEKFAVTGYSKLGTATFVAGAADPRVKAIVPVAVYLRFGDLFPDVLPSETHFMAAFVRRHFEKEKSIPSTIVQAFAKAYMPVILTSKTDAFARLSSIIDPASPSFAKRLTLPKYMILAGSDAVVRESGQGRDKLPMLPSPSRFLEVPNFVHDDSLVKTISSNAAFLRGQMLGLTPPEIAYSYIGTNRTIVVTAASNHTPKLALRWIGQPSSDNLWHTSEVEETRPGCRCWQATVPLNKTSFGESGVAGVLLLAYDWPEPGLVFRVSTPPLPGPRPRS